MQLALFLLLALAPAGSHKAEVVSDCPYLYEQSAFDSLLAARRLEALDQESYPLRSWIVKGFAFPANSQLGEVAFFVGESGADGKAELELIRSSVNVAAESVRKDGSVKNSRVRTQTNLETRELDAKETETLMATLQRLGASTGKLEFIGGAELRLLWREQGRVRCVRVQMADPEVEGSVTQYFWSLLGPSD